MRDAMQIELTVGEYHDAKRVERHKHLVHFLTQCAAARERGDDWIRWIDARHNGDHLHGARMADGKTIAACPVRGCPILEDSRAA